MEDQSTAPSRRRFLGAATATGAAVWAVPAILSVDAAAAASAGGGAGSISGVVTTCGNPIDVADSYNVAASGPGSGSANTDSLGNYTITGLPDGVYDITLTPNGNGNTGQPVQPPANNPHPVVNGGPTTQNLDYTENGC